MSKKLVSSARSIERRLVYAYAAAGLALFGGRALRADAFAGWMWGSLLILVLLVASLRSALVFTYRKVPSKLNWWIRPTAGETDLMAMWLVYAVFFGAGAVLIVFL